MAPLLLGGQRAAPRFPPEPQQRWMPLQVTPPLLQQDQETAPNPALLLLGLSSHPHTGPGPPGLTIEGF